MGTDDGELLDGGLLDDDDGLDELPYLPEVALFDVDSGEHVDARVPADSSRFGHAWRDPEPEPELRMPRLLDDDGSGHYVPGEGRSRSAARPAMALLLLLAAMALVGGLVGYGFELWGGKRVPDMVGASEGNARAALEAKGLAVEVEPRPVDDGIGFVLSSSPEAGTRVPDGSAVTLVVGVDRTIPDVLGVQESRARQELIDAGAVEIRTVYETSERPEGTVLAVAPGVGEAFTSRDVIELTVAQSYTVPDVVGKAERDAVAAVEEVGLVAEVQLVADEGVAGTVISTEPEAGTRLEEGDTVELRVVASTPASFAHVAEYFDALPAAIASYLEGEGFWLRSGWLNDLDEAQALYGSDDHGTLAFSSRPFSHAFDTSAGSAYRDVLGRGNAFAGVRWELPETMVPQSARQLSPTAMSSVEALCALEGESDSCNQNNVEIPDGAVKSGARFSCAYGEMGNLAWTVLLAREHADVRAVVTCAPKALYDAYDLEPYGGRICCLVAYADMYTEWTGD